MPARFVRGTFPSLSTVPALTFQPADARAVLDPDALASLASEVESLKGDAASEVVALLGARDELFAAGADLDALARLTPEEAQRFADLGRSVLAAWESLEKTTVVVVKGACFGGALDLVLATDVVVAFPSARFAHPGVHRGIVTGWGGTVRAARRLSRAALLELFAEGEPVSGERAAANGLVDVLVEDEAGVTAALQALSGESGALLRRLKRAARLVDAVPLATALVVEEREATLPTTSE